MKLGQAKALFLIKESAFFLKEDVWQLNAWFKSRTEVNGSMLEKILTCSKK
ncbi:hypothetical protein THIOM_005438 [Candidatus Thiomargarita nelsonii]|uniref:Uncharacterized protein n=1 Tax=Candidatus Thiomargarita nelsonii TaxID=1003181 RepID=A0A176RT47_9GAMM|nr:hypothetical protein THIOM_005438 [Candidatus Thiomargarita nelsonii]